MIMVLSKGMVVCLHNYKVKDTLARLSAKQQTLLGISHRHRVKSDKTALLSLALLESAHAAVNEQRLAFSSIEFSRGNQLISSTELYA